MTTLATLWKVQRRDGQIFGFTDHDRNIAYDDGSGDGVITYLARSGYTRTAIESTADHDYSKSTYFFSKESVGRVTERWQPFVARFNYHPPDPERAA